MPLEVRHIAIRMRVGDPPPPAAGPARAGHPVPPSLSTDDRAALVRDCTRAVLAALARRGER